MAQRAVQAAVAGAESDLVRRSPQQAVAVATLRKGLDEGAPRDQAAHAADEVSVLIRHQTPETPLIAEAVAQCAPAWPATNRVRFARDAAEVGERLLRERLDCDGCEPDGVDRPAAAR